MAKDEKLVKALNDLSLKPRGNLIELAADNYRFDYYDIYENDSHYEFLNKRGFQGGGPSWRGIVFGAIRMSEPSIQNKIKFDDEADGLAIWGTEKESLLKIGRLIAVVKSDEQILLKVIQVAEQAGEME